MNRSGAEDSSVCNLKKQKKFSSHPTPAKDKTVFKEQLLQLYSLLLDLPVYSKQSPFFGNQGVVSIPHPKHARRSQHNVRARRSDLFEVLPSVQAKDERDHARARTEVVVLQRTLRLFQRLVLCSCMIAFIFRLDRWKNFEKI